MRVVSWSEGMNEFGVGHGHMSLGVVRRPDGVTWYVLVGRAGVLLNFGIDAAGRRILGSSFSPWMVLGVGTRCAIRVAY